MAATAWGGAAWIIVAFLTMVLIIPLGVLSGVRMAAIGRANAQASGPLAPAIQDRLRHPLLRTSLLLRTTMSLGIIFLMTVKPNMLGSVATIGIAIVAGLVASLPAWNNRQAGALTDSRSGSAR